MRAALKSFLTLGALAVTSGAALAAGAIEGGGKQALNMPAIMMFGAFVLYGLSGYLDALMQRFRRKPAT